MEIYINKGIYGWQTIAKNNDDKMYIDVVFKKDIEPDDTYLKIKINRGFFSMYKTKTGLVKPKLIIMDYNILSKNDTEEIANDETLPF